MWGSSLPPNNTALCELLRSLSSGGTYTHVCIMGDMNLPQINWSLYSTATGERSVETEFLNALEDSFLFQHVSEPTRQRGTNTPSLLYLIISNEADMVSDIEYQSPLGKSDHSLLSFTYHCYLDNSKVGR